MILADARMRTEYPILTLERTDYVWQMHTGRKDERPDIALLQPWGQNSPFCAQPRIQGHRSGWGDRPEICLSDSWGGTESKFSLKMLMTADCEEILWVRDLKISPFAGTTWNAAKSSILQPYCTVHCAFQNALVISFATF